MLRRGGSFMINAPKIKGVWDRCLGLFVLVRAPEMVAVVYTLSMMYLGVSWAMFNGISSHTDKVKTALRTLSTVPYDFLSAVFLNSHFSARRHP